MNAISEERLQELRNLRDRMVAFWQEESGGDGAFPEWLDDPSPNYEFVDAVNEIDRLEEVLREIAYNTSTSVPLGADWPNHYRVQLLRVISMAANALHQEEDIGDE